MHSWINPAWSRPRAHATRAASVFAAVALFVFAFGFAAGPASAATELDVWTFWPETYYTDVFAEFEAENPGVTVVHEQLDWANGLDKITIAIAARSGPDLVELGSTWMPQFMGANALAPIDVSALGDDVTGLDSATRGGDVFGIPWFGTANVIYYNKGLFREAGVEGEPVTWDELKEASEKIAALGPDIYGYSLKIGGRFTTWQKFYPFVWSNGGHTLNDDWTASTVTEQPFVEALQYYHELAASSLVGTQEEARQAFELGKLGMMMDGTLNLDQDAPDIEWGTFLIPAPAGRDSVAFSGADYLAVWAGSKEADLAGKLAVKMATGNLISSQVPTLISFSRADQEAHLEAHPEIGLFVEAMANATHPPLHPDWEEIATYVTEAVEGLLLGQFRTAEEALEYAAFSIDSILW